MPWVHLCNRLFKTRHVKFWWILWSSQLHRLPHVAAAFHWNILAHWHNALADVMLNSLDFWPFPTIMKIGMSVRTGQTSKLLHRLALPNFHTMEMPHSHPFIPTPEFLNPKSCAVFGKDTDYTNVIRDFLFFRRNWKIYQEQKLKGENIYILNIKLNF